MDTTQWYGAAKDCDLSGVRVGDAPKEDLAALRVLGPVNDDQEDFIKTAVSDYRAVRREMGVKDGRDDVAALKAKGFHDLGNLMEKARKVEEGEEAADFGHIQEMMRVVRMMESGAKPNGSWGGKGQRKGKQVGAVTLDCSRVGNRKSVKTVQARKEDNQPHACFPPLQSSRHHRD